MILFQASVNITSLLFLKSNDTVNFVLYLASSTYLNILYGVLTR